MALTDKLVSIGDAIRSKLGTTEAIPLSDMPDKVDEVYEAGKDETWNFFTNNKTKTNFLFSSIDAEELPYVENLNNAIWLRTYTACTNLKVARFKMSDKVNTIQEMFSGCQKLERIETLNLTSLENSANTFSNCKALTTIIFEGTIRYGKTANINLQWSPLSVETLSEIVNRLKDYSGTETTAKITLGSGNVAKLTEEQKLIMQNKQWDYN